MEGNNNERSTANRREILKRAGIGVGAFSVGSQTITDVGRAGPSEEDLTEIGSVQLVEMGIKYQSETLTPISHTDQLTFHEIDKDEKLLRHIVVSEKDLKLVENNSAIYYYNGFGKIPSDMINEGREQKVIPLELNERYDPTKTARLSEEHQIPNIAIRQLSEDKSLKIISENNETIVPPDSTRQLRLEQRSVKAITRDNSPSDRSSHDIEPMIVVENHGQLDVKAVQIQGGAQ